MRGAGKTCLGGAVLAAAAVALPASASAEVTIGSRLQTSPVNVDSCQSQAPCTAANFLLPGTQLASPTDGVVVRWRLRPAFASADTEVRLRVLRPTAGEPFKGANTSAVRTIGPIDASTTLTFSTRQRILAGDHIGLNSDKFIIVSGVADDIGFGVWSPPLGDGGTRAPDTTSNLELLLNADVEPDTDSDGFGDETQDDCPSSPGPRNGCETTPPETTITKAPKRKLKTRKRKRKVRFKFVSSEPGSDFRCVVDDEPPVACDSPFKHRFRRGKHRFEVEAIDVADNADPTPAIARFKLKRKH